MPKFIAFAGLGAVLAALVVAAVHYLALPILIAYIALGLAAFLIALRAILDAVQHLRGSNSSSSPASDPLKDARIAAKREAKRRRQRLLARLHIVLADLRAAQPPPRWFYRERGSPPWWLVLGPPGHGKTALLRAAPDARELAPPADTDEPRFFLAAGALFLELPDDPPPADLPALTALLARLRRLRPRRPLAGILLVHRADDLLGPTSPDLRPTRRSIDRVAAALALQVPVLLLVSQLDRLAGHAELLEGLPPVRHALGVVLPLREGKHSVLTAATASLDALDGPVAWVRQRCHALVARATPGAPRQTRLYGLWQQFSRLAAAAAAAAAQLAHDPLPGGDPLRIRGIFFVSAHPDHLPPPDHWAAALAQRLGGRLTDDPPQHPDPGPAFLADLFTGELVRAGLHATRSDRYLRRRFLATALTALLLAAAAGLAIHGSTRAARTNEGLLQTTLDHAAAVQHTPPEQLAPLAPLLGLQHALTTWRAPHAPPGAGWGLFPGHQLRQGVTDTYLRAVCSGVLRPLLTRTRAALRQFASRHAAAGQVSSEAFDDAFNALRAYLLLSHPSGPTEPPPWGDEQSAWLLRQVVGAWTRASADGDPSQREALLADYIALLPEAHPDPASPDLCLRTGHRQPLDRDPELVAAVREILHRTPPNRDHVTRMVDQVNRRSDLIAVSVRGLTTAQHLRSDLWVPPAFTRPGWLAFQAILTRELDGGGEQTWVLGLKQAAETRQARCDSLRALYTDLYQRAWDRFIRSLRLDSPIDLITAAAIFRELAEDAPLTAIFKAVADHTQGLPPIVCSERRSQPDNLPDLLRSFTPSPAPRTTTITGDAAKIAAAFARFTAFGAAPPTKGAAPPGPLMLGSYHKRLAELRSAIDKAIDNDAQLPALATALTDALADITSMIQRGPFGPWKEPLQQLLTPPLNGLDVYLDSDKMKGLHAEWCATVHASLQRTVVGRYPFLAGARQDAVLADLEPLFHPQTGEIAKFHGKWLSGYADIRGNDIEAARLGVGARYHMSARALDFFDAAHKLGLLLYGDGPIGLDLGLLLRCDPTVQRVVLTVDGLPTDYDCSIDQARQIRWPGKDPPKDGKREARLTAHGNGRIDELPQGGEFGLLRLFEGAQPTLRPRQSAFDLVFVLPRREFGKLRATVQPRDLRGGNLFFGFGGARFLAPLRAPGFLNPPQSLFNEFAHACPAQP